MAHASGQHPHSQAGHAHSVPTTDQNPVSWRMTSIRYQRPAGLSMSNGPEATLFANNNQRVTLHIHEHPVFFEPEPGPPYPTPWGHNYAYLCNWLFQKHIQAKLTHASRIPRDDSHTAAKPSFSLFSQLPPEMRMAIWETICPDLLRPSRIFEFRCGAIREGQEAGDWTVVNSPSLKSATLSIRTLLAVCVESRELVLERLPDTLTFTCYPESRKMSTFDSHDDLRKGLIRWNKEKDIALISGAPYRFSRWSEADVYRLDGFAENVRNVAININRGYMLNEVVANDYLWLLVQFPKIKNFYYTLTCQEHPWYMNYWCTASACRQYTVRGSILYGQGIEEQLYCWPREGSNLQIPAPFLDKPQRLKDVQRMAGWNVEPMMRFRGAHEISLYQDLIQETKMARPLSEATKRSPLYELLHKMEGRPLAETLVRMETDRLVNDHPAEVIHYLLTAFQKPWEAPVWVPLRN